MADQLKCKGVLQSGLPCKYKFVINGYCKLHDPKKYEQCDECSICLGVIKKKGMFSSSSSIRTLKCTHSYHKKCIDKWEKQSETCPVCREYIDTSLVKQAIRNKNIERLRIDRLRVQEREDMELAIQLSRQVEDDPVFMWMRDIYN
jgi:hypothetical protein